MTEQPKSTDAENAESRAPADATPPEDDTFVIGDVHGHLDRLQALLEQEGIMGNCDWCGGSGKTAFGIEFKDLMEIPGHPTLKPECGFCNGEGYRRLRYVTVIQLGDLGHFGGASGTPTGDSLCWEAALDGWIDLVLWGNHDRAVVDPGHIFGGYQKPDPEIRHMMELLDHAGRLKMATSVHGYLLTHAGLHAEWKHQKDVPIDKDDPVKVAEYVNGLVNEKSVRRFDGSLASGSNRAIIDAIGHLRGGWSPHGGILWRDFREKLYKGFPQIFGHSASRQHVVRRDPGNPNSYCIDIGGKGGHHDPSGDCLAGIWLPSKKVVRVDL